MEIVNVIEVKVTKINKIIFGRLIAAFLFVAVMAGSWDAWWHVAIGRDSFWEPPHFLLYTSVILAISFGFYAWYHSREKVWRRLAMILALIPLSAPFDEMWHRWFGVERLDSIWILWSPPHVLLLLALAGSFYMLLSIINKDKDIVARRLFTSLLFAGILVSLLFLAAPFEPTGGFAILGFWGAGVDAVILIGILLLAKRWISGVGAATSVIAFFLVLTSIGYGEQFAPGVEHIPHDHPPLWLSIFAVMAPAVYLDLVKKKTFMHGAVAAFLWAGILYGFSSMFFEPQFMYTLADGAVAIVASLIGGLLAGLAAPKFFK